MWLGNRDLVGQIVAQHFDRCGQLGPLGVRRCQDQLILSPSIARPLVGEYGNWIGWQAGAAVGYRFRRNLSFEQGPAMIIFSIRTEFNGRRRVSTAVAFFVAACVSFLSQVAPASAPADSAAADDDLQRYRFEERHMGVAVTIVLYAPDKVAATRASERAYSRLAELDAILSDYQESSELSRLSRSSPTKDFVRVSEDLWNVLVRSQQLAEASNGAFDVTVGPLTRLWRRARREKTMPKPSVLDEALKAVGHRNLELDPQSHGVKLKAPKMQLDLGGIGMGYAIDEMFVVLEANGIERAMIDGSGDIGVSNPPPGRDGWIIGIAPLAPEQPAKRYVVLRNAAITTSGDAYQFVEIGGKRYSHIVDPSTGKGLTDHSSVTVVARDCVTADSYATAVSVLGPDQGLKLIEDTPGAAALIVRAPRKDNEKAEAYQSERFKRLSFIDGAEDTSDDEP